MNYKNEVSIIIGILSCTMFAACSTTKVVEVKKLDDQLEEKGQVGFQRIGLDKDNQAVIEDNNYADDELRQQIWKNYELEQKVTSEREDLQQCRTDFADPRLGGNKELVEIPDIAINQDISKIRQSFGLTENGELKVIRKELYEERLTNEQKYGESLAHLEQQIKKYAEDCERQLGYVRTQHGLPSNRFVARGHYDSEGRFIMEEKAEHNLDDAFAIIGKTAAAKPELPVEVKITKQ